MNIKTIPQLYLTLVPNASTINQQILQRFGDFYDHPNTQRSHFFHGRFENIYIDQTYIPEILPVLTAAKQAASKILQKTEEIRCGYWFNLMRPGDQTSLHAHEEDDELLSAVYYVAVAEHCGDLVLGTPPLAVRIKPLPGMMVFFPPSLPHAVEINVSGQNRLSIAFNFGPAESQLN